ncbi:hypothetical protein BKA56DRAFT_619359 [Ilyonectria sp. MPI-CAGE-AT-0026]|nr:hypothetical protein BKA56DRAFT_619359 [Ilyonectria sp. MPI-CAGE-AT-0026]
MPRLEISEFLDYLRAFNKKDYDKQHAFYADNIQLIVPDPAIGTLKGSKGIMDHYGPVHANADEFVIPISVMSDRGKVFLQMESYFKYLNKAKGVHDIDVVPGDIIKITTCALYDLDEQNKMTLIRCYLGSAEKLGQVDLKEVIRDSEGRASPDLRLYNY